jgi:hypothetical protein
MSVKIVWNVDKSMWGDLIAHVSVVYLLASFFETKDY